MCLCARMLALEWKERAFIETVNSRWFFVDFRRPYLCTTTVHKYDVSIQSSTKVRETFRQITQKLSVGHEDLRLGKIVYILVFYNISFSWPLPLDGFQFISLLGRFVNDWHSTLHLIMMFGLKYQNVNAASSFCNFVEWTNQHEKNQIYCKLLAMSLSTKKNVSSCDVL